MELRVYRFAMAVVIIATVVDRWSVLKCFMSDEGILPVAAWQGQLLSTWWSPACVHAWSGRVEWIQALSLLQILFAIAMIRWPSLTFVSLWLYASATVRFVQSAYILDRYVLVNLLFLACDDLGFLWRLQLWWIYLDAGSSKLLSGGWSLNDDLPAVDAYLRHTYFAHVLRRYVLSPYAMRFMTPLVPILEVIAPTIALWSPFVSLPIAVIWLFHIGIGLGMNGAGLLSIVACVSWIPVLRRRPSRRRRTPVVILTAYLGACVYFAIQDHRLCLDASSAPLSTLFHNRWNVFAASDDTVVFEIMPGRLRNGDVVDLWKQGPVSWDVPDRAPRRGRWRTFPMISNTDADPDRLNATYSFFCREWNSLPNVLQDPGLEVLHFHVYMLQASVLNTSNISKRLLHVQRCWDV